MGNNFDEGNRVPVFGFRSGKSYKMIMAILYYLLAAFIVVTSLVNEFRYYSFETMDVVLVIIKYVFITVFFFSPLIFLSDFKYTYKIPLFKKKQRGSSVVGILIVLGFCYFMTQVNIYCCSNLYKDSVKEYSLKVDKQSVLIEKKKMDSDEINLMLANLQVAKGYHVEVATEKEFKNTIFSKNYDKAKITLKSAKFVNNKKLFVRAKSYGTVKKKVIEGKWSNVVKVRFKKNRRKK